MGSHPVQRNSATSQAKLYQALKSEIIYPIGELLLLQPAALNQISHRPEYYNFYKKRAETEGYIDLTANDNRVIYFAAEHSELEIIKILMSYKNIRLGLDSNRAIETATNNKHVDVLEYFLGFDEKYISTHGNFVLTQVCKHGDSCIELIKSLLSSPLVDPTTHNHAALRLAAAYGQTNTVNLLLADGRVDPSAEDNYAICWASEGGHYGVVKLLLTDCRVDPSTRVNSAIRFAAENGHYGVVKLLLTDYRVDASAGNNDAIRLASANGQYDVVKLLLTNDGVDPSAENNDAIRSASANGHYNIVKLLLTDNRVDPGTALCSAASHGYYETVKLLLTDGRVDPSACNNLAIHYAAAYGHYDVVKLLLTDKRVDPSAEGNLAIFWAAQVGHTRIVNLLLNDPRVNKEKVLEQQHPNNTAIKKAFALIDGYKKFSIFAISQQRAKNSALELPNELVGEIAKTFSEVLK